MASSCFHEWLVTFMMSSEGQPVSLWFYENLAP